MSISLSMFCFAVCFLVNIYQNLVFEPSQWLDIRYYSSTLISKDVKINYSEKYISCKNFFTKISSFESYIFQLTVLNALMI